MSKLQELETTDIFFIATKSTAASLFYERYPDTLLSLENPRLYRGSLTFRTNGKIGTLLQVDG